MTRQEAYHAGGARSSLSRSTLWDMGISVTRHPSTVAAICRIEAAGASTAVAPNLGTRGIDAPANTGIPCVGRERQWLRPARSRPVKFLWEKSFTDGCWPGRAIWGGRGSRMAGASEFLATRVSRARHFPVARCSRARPNSVIHA